MMFNTHYIIPNCIFKLKTHQLFFLIPIIIKLCEIIVSNFQQNDKLVFKYSIYNKYFVYHSVIENSERLRENIKGIALKLTLPDSLKKIL